MFKNLTVGKKIGLGFSSVIGLLLVVGFIAYNTISDNSEGFNHYRAFARHTNLAGRIQANMLKTRMVVKDFILTAEEKKFEEFRDDFKKTEEFISQAKEQITEKDLAEKIRKIETLLNEYAKAFQKVHGLIAEQKQMVEKVLNIKGPIMEKNLTAILEGAQKNANANVAFEVGMSLQDLLLGRLYMVKFLESMEKKDEDRAASEFAEMDKRLSVLNKDLENTEDRGRLAEVAMAYKEYTSTFDKLVKAVLERHEIIEQTMDRIGPEIADLTEDIKLAYMAEQDKLGPSLVAANNRSMVIVLIVVVAALLTAALLAFGIGRGISRALQRIIEGLNEGAEQVASASSQVSTASQSLAEGSSQQAASIEETSSSLEEIASMTKQNAEHSNQADTLMKEANAVVGHAIESMSELTASMGEITRASEETSKIIKTIDEIAFQTNLLALNAAVEAARAGEAGAGFAVVADEVRNLAMRASEAAKNTANLIESTVKKIKDGSVLVSRTDEAFSKVAQSASKVGSLVTEIAAASHEQTQGIEQVNKSVAEMDKVVQQNAANAEENASASEEMYAQSSQMQNFVGDLMAMVTGNRNGNSSGAAKQLSLHHAPKKMNTGRQAKRKASSHLPVPGNARKSEASPEQVIPLLENDFKDF